MTDQLANVAIALFSFFPKKSSESEISWLAEKDRLIVRKVKLVEVNLRERGSIRDFGGKIVLS
jgi:hypothetical protein